MSGEGIVSAAEREVIDAALAWADEQARGVSSATSGQRLRAACYMLRKARGITGKIRAVEIDATKKDPIG